MGRQIAQKPRATSKSQDQGCLDSRLASILDAIEAERVPDRLLKLAQELQIELATRKERRNPK